MRRERQPRPDKQIIEVVERDFFLVAAISAVEKLDGRHCLLFLPPKEFLFSLVEKRQDHANLIWLNHVGELEAKYRKLIYDIKKATVQFCPVGAVAILAEAIEQDAKTV